MLVQVVHAEPVEGKSANTDIQGLLVLCEKRFARVIHERLAIYEPEDKIDDGTVISLAHYVEFHQWSAATDLYGVGAIFLYTLLCTGMQLEAGYSMTQHRALDARFAETIRVLESVSYFQSLWADIENCRSDIESLYDESPKLPTSEIFNRQTKATLGEDKSLVGKAEQAVNNIVQSAPNTRVILEMFGWNMAHFLFFTHFVLSCLHRQNHLPDKGAINDDGVSLRTEDSMPEPSRQPLYPFCETRVDKLDGKAAEKALQRLERLSEMLQRDNFFAAFGTSEGAIAKYNPKSDFAIRIEYERVNKKLQALDQENEAMDGRYHQLAEVYQKAEEEGKRSKERYEKAEKDRDKAEKEREKAMSHLRSLQDDYFTLLKHIESSASVLRSIAQNLSVFRIFRIAESRQRLDSLRSDLDSLLASKTRDDKSAA